jgi:ribosomal protein S18 acetylase RimI-like enzyme
MADLTLQTADTLTYQSLSRLLNQAYTDYYVSIWLDARKFEAMCDEVDVDLARSVVALVDETPVGMALLSRRDAEGWISGVGVRPRWRRRGIARRMIRRLQRDAPDVGLTRLQLEVLEQNDAGIALYEDLGFRWARELVVMTLEAGAVPLTRVPPAITSAQPRDLLQAYAAFHDVTPPWQRALRSIRRRVSDLQGLALREDGQLAGYVLYQPTQTIYTVIDLAVDPAYPDRMRAGERLLRALHGTRSDLGGYVVNVPAQDPLLPAFTSVGYRAWQRQHEMVWKVG